MPFLVIDALRRAAAASRDSGSEVHRVRRRLWKLRR
jgi:hypothetical protein